jgi:uncharacterized membrane protein YagU involved in acid resistance
MELFVGVVIGFFIQSIIKAGWRMLNPPHVPPQPSARTPAQLANQAAFEAHQAATPKAVRIRVQRRVQRGRRRDNMEREEDSFE